MSIRKKTGIVIGMTVLILIVLLYGISRTILCDGFKKIEKGLIDGFSRVEFEDALKNVSRVVDAYEVQRSNLVIKAADWAMWDDTYRFVVDTNLAYRKSNLNVSTLRSLEINYIAIINHDQKSVFTLMADGDSVSHGEVIELSGYSHIVRSVQTKLTPVSGIAVFHKRPMLVTVLPILQSDGSGPSHGVFIFGRFIDNDFIAGLAAVTHLELSWSMSAAKLQMNTLDDTCSNSLCIHKMTDSLITGKAVLYDMGDSPTVFIQVNMPRTIHQHALQTLAAVQRRGRVTLISLVVSIMITGLTLLGVIFVILEVSVLRRLHSIACKSEAIGNDGAAEQRLPVEGDDEITILAVAINKMLDALQASHDAIALRDREKLLLMNSVPVGICSFGASMEINPEYSKMLCTLFGVSGCAGRTVLDLLALKGESDGLGADLLSYLDLVLRRIVSDRELSELNPIKEFHFTGRSMDAWYAIGFYSVQSGEDDAPGVLMTVTDITDEKLLGRENEEIQRENIQLRQIAENPDFFREFIRETRRIVETVNTIASSLTVGAVKVKSVHALFRGVHTIKGVAGSFGLKRLESVTGELEENLSSILEQQELTKSGATELSGLLEKLSSAIREVELLSATLFGGLSEEGGDVVHVSVAVVNKAITELQAIRGQISPHSEQVDLLCDEACARFRELAAVPAGTAFSRSLRLVPRLCERLGKECKVSLSGAEVPIDLELAQTINQMLIHLLRNAVDHGIEIADFREKCGKSREGHVGIVVEKNRGKLIVTVTDDGRGIDVAAISNVACAKGVITREMVAAMSKDAIHAMVFLPGLSTSETISEVSGRGVGLDMVADTVKNVLHGQITVESEWQRGTAFTITLPV